MNKFTHINEQNQPKMVNVSDKKITKRTAIAKATMYLGTEIISHFNNEELITKKGPVFQTAIIAGIQAVKKTSDIIPMCHPLLINGVDININIIDTEHIEVLCKVTIEGKTGVEMEALTGASATCLTIYDMCKAINQEMVIKEVKLLEKTGGKSDIKNG
ncbi:MULTISPECIES: cyclic pyranopterin monophosphate synthase MoaC [unclassified Tenacibaculum]|uniref:cyclic pyranopterin monophosphate synthase MoaC n=1 Tax=unclassified Tenacibaculum TaxID=2635139 RepID=UPI001F40C950|nr:MULTISPECIES: cyclic pyranopterin monophosphate synthase MoaC [unclassified Tenacibaculum]MCF2874719.1 cyclic pyranopterin monophosphate synthase MoaC [Tenacibaculum sp. Cn5-1]MCF2934215.1 cyclic pyranopterin monophosphate synthase MoaC [Tenacibaculum sp. Cn5-34]MCG7510425.1 cyclic pyranopterin monophosphate synthase MoaC [Tenacibaculum sp. Cn5-46]